MKQTDIVPDQDLMTSKETASFLRVSDSWLAKARMAEEGPPFMQFGRSIRYSKSAVARWMKSQQR
jgi:predicted DNA-binding transcriptional regulator AlpA